MYLSWRVKHVCYRSHIFDFDMQKMLKEHNKYIHMSIPN
jgi:hypothetical protein